MKGTIGALNFNLLEKIVDFEEAFIHPSVNLATNYTRFALANQLALIDYTLENYKMFLGLTQTLLGVPIVGQKEINMVNPQRQLDYLHNATQRYFPHENSSSFSC